MVAGYGLGSGVLRHRDFDASPLSGASCGRRLSGALFLKILTIAVAALALAACHQPTPAEVAKVQAD